MKRQVVLPAHPLGKLTITQTNGYILVSNGKYTARFPITFSNLLDTAISGITVLNNILDILRGFRINVAVRPVRDGTLVYGDANNMKVTVKLSETQQAVIQVKYPDGIGYDGIIRAVAFAFREYNVRKLRDHWVEIELNSPHTIIGLKRLGLLTHLLDVKTPLPQFKRDQTMARLDLILRANMMTLYPELTDEEITIDAIGEPTTITNALQTLVEEGAIVFQDGDLYLSGLGKLSEFFGSFNNHVRKVLEMWKVRENIIVSVTNKITLRYQSFYNMLDDRTLLMLMDYGVTHIPPKYIINGRRREEVVAKYIETTTPRFLTYIVGSPVYRRFLSDEHLKKALLRISIDVPSYLTELFYNSFPEAITIEPRKLIIRRGGGLSVIQKDTTVFMVTYASGITINDYKQYAVFTATRHGYLLPIHVNARTIEEAVSQIDTAQTLWFDNLLDYAQKNPSRVSVELVKRGKLVVGAKIWYQKENKTYLVGVNVVKRPVLWRTLYKMVATQHDVRKTRATRDKIYQQPPA